MKFCRKSQTLSTVTIVLSPQVLKNKEKKKVGKGRQKNREKKCHLKLQSQQIHPHFWQLLLTKAWKQQKSGNQWMHCGVARSD